MPTNFNPNRNPSLGRFMLPSLLPPEARTYATLYDGKRFRGLLCILKLHRWRTALTTATTTYAECKSCGTRLVVQFPGGFKIDWHWLQTGEWSNQMARFQGRKAKRPVATEGSDYQ